MSSAQRVQRGPFFHLGAIQGGAKLYHYEAGTFDTKDIWDDREKFIPLPQPFVADANGVFNFFAEGLYKIIICRPGSAGPTDLVLYTLDNWQFLDPSINSLQQGESIPTATTMPIGPDIWAHWTGSNDVEVLTGETPFHWAVADGNFSLIYSSSLLTPASINVGVRQGDVLFFLNEGGGIWRLAAHYQHDGLVIATADARTNTVDVPLTVRSTTSETPAAGMGTGVLFQAESADESPSDVGQVEFAASDVGAGSEDTFFQILLRVAGAALTACYRFVATGAFKAILTHANSADRTYTLQNASYTIIGRDTTDTLTNKTFDAQGTGNTLSNVSTSALKTATGSASGSVTGGTTVNIALNDYSFFPNVQWQANTGGGPLDMYAMNVADSGTTVGRFALTNLAGANSDDYVVRWRYVTASDDPIIWALQELSTERLVGVWASDDPLAGNIPGLAMQGCRAVVLRSADLESLPALTGKASDAADYIRERKMKMQHQAYRALQMLASDTAPSAWIMAHCALDAEGRLMEKR